MPIRAFGPTCALGSSKNIFILCAINPDATGIPATTRAANTFNTRNVLIFVVFAPAHLATDTFYSASSFCNARNEFAATTRAVAKHLRGNARKFVSCLFSVWYRHRAVTDVFEGCSARSSPKTIKMEYSINETDLSPLFENA